MYSISLYLCSNFFFFPDNDHGANNKCSTKKWKEADVYIHDILDVYKHMQCSDVARGVWGYCPPGKI